MPPTELDLAGRERRAAERSGLLKAPRDVRLLWFVYALWIATVVVCVVWLVSGCSAAPPSTWCERSCKRSAGCENDPDPKCIDFCQEAESQCPDEAHAYARCTVEAPERKLYCDVHGRTQTDACEAQVGALAACMGAP